MLTKSLEDLSEYLSDNESEYKLSLKIYKHYINTIISKTTHEKID